MRRLFQRWLVRYRASPLGGGLLLWELLPLLVLLGGTAAVETHVGEIRQRAVAIERSALLNQLSALRARLEAEMNGTLHRVQGLVAVVATDADISDERFQKLAERITRDAPHIRNLGLAPDNVLSFVYPKRSNEAAIGLRYRDVPAQWPAVERAMLSGETVIAGPIDLVQGGTALVARTPIFNEIRDEDGSVVSRYWGIASTVISDLSLFADALILDRLNADIALRIGDRIILGDPALFKADTVRAPVQVPGDVWELAAQWHADSSPLVEEVRRTRFVAYGLLLGILLVAGLLAASHRRRVRDALHDPLTGLANRRLLFTRLELLGPIQQRRKGRVYLFFLDLDGFKPVNDRHGHHAGDGLLVEIGRRLTKATRNSDTVARTGGDEFVIAMADIDDDLVADQVAEKLEQVVSEPMDFQGTSISVGVSVGWASMPGDADDPDSLMKVADRRMYDTKMARREALAA